MPTPTERLPALAAELVGLKVDVIFAMASPAIRAAKQTTTTIPIVMETPATPWARPRAEPRPAGR